MAQAATPIAIAPPSPRALFESALFESSPVGTSGTTLAIFLGLLASFGAVLAIDGYSPISAADRRFELEPGVWPAFVLSLLVAVALGMQRYARLRERADQPDLQKVMPRCADFEIRMRSPEAIRQLRWATAIGALCGVAPTLAAVPRELIGRDPAIYLWFAAANSLVGALFARGIAQSVRGIRNWTGAIDDGLIIDLLRIDSLNVIGRHGARNALIWFSVAAVILLFFIGNNMGPVILAILALAAAMGIWIFMRPAERVHRRIRAAKQVELESIRRAIQDARGHAPHDAGAAAKLQGLLAYETRIQAVREWPFDQPTAFRVAAYVLIPAIPWFGQAIAGYLVNNLVHIPV
jgi:hypothetical protein